MQLNGTLDKNVQQTALDESHDFKNHIVLCGLFALAETLMQFDTRADQCLLCP